MSINLSLDNPFLRLPITFEPDTFFGSQSAVNYVLSTVSETGIIAPIELLGLPGMGKTTLLRYIRHPNGALKVNKASLKPPFQEQPHLLLPVLIEFRLSGDQNPFIYLYEHFRKELLAYQERFPSTIRRHLDVSKKLTDLTPHGISQSISQLTHVIEELADNKIRPVFLLDDFDLAFKNMTDSLEIDALRPLREYAAFVLAMEQPLHKLNLKVYGSPFFQNTPIICMGGLSDEEAKTLINSTSNNQFPTCDVDFIVKLSGGHAYLSILSGRVLWDIRARLNILSEKNTDLSEKHRETLQAKLKDVFQVPFKLYWEKLDSKERAALKNFNNKDNPEINEIILTQLADLGLVRVHYQKDTVNFEFFSPLFQDFLDNVEETPTAAFIQQNNSQSPSNLRGLESMLYEYLLRHTDRVCSYGELWQEVWGQPAQGLDDNEMRRRMQVTVSRLRSKLQAFGENIIGVRDQGYRLITPNIP